MASGFSFRPGAKVEDKTDAVSRALLVAANGALRDEGKDAKGKLRADTAAGLGDKMGRTWRINIYPRTGLANDPAMTIGNSEAYIIAAFSVGVTIVAAERQYLAIPTPEALAAYRATRPKNDDNGQFLARDPWPQVIAAQLGGVPRTYVEPGGQRGLVYVQAGKTRKVIGWLEHQAVLGKRIEGTALLDRIAETLPLTYTGRFEDYLDAQLQALDAR